MVVIRTARLVARLDAGPRTALLRAAHGPAPVDLDLGAVEASAQNRIRWWFGLPGSTRATDEGAAGAEAT